MNVAIVGAGLAGRVLAWRLNELSQGVKITLIDQQDRNFVGTGLIAAAMVAPYTEAVSTEAITQHLGAQSFKLWSEWLPSLEEQVNQLVSFNKKGTLVVSHAQDDPDWQRFLIKAKAVLDTNQMQQFDHAALQTSESELAQNFAKALYFPNEGVINNQTLYPALNAYFEQSDNIQFIENCSVDSLGTDGKITGSKIGETDFDYVFDCRGNGAKADLKGFRSVRGEVARVYAPEVNISRAVRLIHPRFPLYIAPRNNHEYIIGATQIESDDNSPVTVRSGLELLSALYSLHQGFGEAQILELLVGLRPTFANNLPRVEYHDRLVRVNGLYRHGYLFSPALINDVITHTFDTDSNLVFPEFINDPNISAGIAKVKQA